MTISSSQGSADADGDLAAVGNEDTADHFKIQGGF